MHTLVVYESMFGNTQQIAHAIASGLSEHVQTEVVPVHLAPADVSGAYDLVVVGGPTHAFSMSRASTRQGAHSQGAPLVDVTGGEGIREWLDGLPGHVSPGLAVAFDTRVAKVRRLPGSAAKKADRVLRQHGLTHITEPESFYVEDTAGPLVEGELARAEAWGRQLGLDLLKRKAKVN